MLTEKQQNDLLESWHDLLLTPDEIAMLKEFWSRATNSEEVTLELTDRYDVV